MSNNLNLPEDTSLPFLVYGIFRPKFISDDVEIIENNSFINQNLIHEIIPIKIKSGNFKNDSYLIYFDKKYSKEAYETICESQTTYLSKWNKINVGGINANVLVQEKRDDNFLDLPSNLYLPFFAYGIFKKNQLAYSRIKEYVKFEPEEHDVNYEMKLRDGVPILIKNIDEYYQARGNLIYFKDEDCTKAYEIISKIEPKQLYDWDIIEINGQLANVLIGKYPDKGSYKFDHGGKIKSYDGRRDPFFREVLDIIKKFNNKNLEVNIENLLELQMHYLLLWAAIERYCDLKYGKDSISKNITEFSKEKIFKESLKNLARFKNKSHVENDKMLKVFSSDDLKEYTLNPQNPKDCIKFYYTIRCNVAHRGKIIIYHDAYLLETSLLDLSEIFENVLKDTFKKDI